jgi:hypothetical protein
VHNPDYITNLYPIPPEKAWVNPKTSEREGSVDVIWGGGFFHLVFHVGPTNFLMSTNLEFNYQTAEWTQGIYYSHEGRRKIR